MDTTRRDARSGRRRRLRGLLAALDEHVRLQRQLLWAPRLGLIPLRHATHRRPALELARRRGGR